MGATPPSCERPMQTRLRPGRRFLRSDDPPERAERMRRGEIVNRAESRPCYPRSCQVHREDLAGDNIEWNFHGSQYDLRW